MLSQSSNEDFSVNQNESDRQEILELTHEEVRDHVERQREELNNRRGTALRTLRATVLLIGVIITFSHQFSQSIQSYAAQPFIMTPSNLLGTFLIPLSGLLLALSPICAAWSLKQGHFSESIDPWDIQSLSDGKLKVEMNGEERNPSLNIEDWYQYIIHKHTDTVSENDKILHESSFYLRLSHGTLALSPVALALGLWLSIV